MQRGLTAFEFLSGNHACGAIKQQLPQRSADFVSLAPAPERQCAADTQHHENEDNNDSNGKNDYA
ncbi:hypothetical protein SKTS_13260 [Sulfurimicrobium lacus]|uniref:Uncharacterized protein n=1 Tax=Sulfurimicrobium lacus TaxID=2715678 RepID=A0A6F8VAT4_9PROT|nr:hypothetical protein SKTS_13260 [Sulfurimicrobium lacus]